MQLSLRSFALLALTRICLIPAAQVIMGTILGTVTDVNGGLLPDARVTIRSMARTRLIRTCSSSGGRFIAGLA